MKLAFITSTDYLNEFASKGTMDMALAPLCLKPDRSDFNREYCEYFKKRAEEGYFVLMDNGAYEKELLSNDMLLEIVNYIKPTCLVAPDVLRNAKATLEKTWSFFESHEYAKMPKKLQIMAVPQGQTLDEYLECYRIFAFDFRVDLIGLNFVSNFNLPGKESADHKDFEQMNNRIALVKYLDHNNLVNKEKKHHLLGLSSPLELNHQKSYDWIFSNDSSCAFIHGATGVKVNPEEGLIDTCTSKITYKSSIDIKDFEYGYADISGKRPQKSLKVHDDYKSLVNENIDIMLGMVQ